MNLSKLYENSVWFNKQIPEKENLSLRDGRGKEGR